MAKTLKEIGQDLNISRFTVSRVLKGSKNVSKKTRKKILNYLKDNPYYPNANANRLYSGKVNVIGLVFSGDASVIFESYVQQIIQGVSQKVRDKEFYLMLFMQEKFNFRECYRLFMTKQVGGFVFPGADRKKLEGINFLQKEKIPLVVLNSHLKKIPSFDCDNIKGGYLATKYLISKGKKSIAYLHGHKGWIDASDRYEGYKQALKEAGVKFNSKYVKINYNWPNEEFVKKALDQLLGLKKLPDAIFTATDRMAIAAVQELQVRNISVPEDMAVVGFDDIPLASIISPALTTVRQPTAEMAEKATAVLINMIESSKKPKDLKLFKPHLVVRKSA
jgi:DNA-binding LacI/PurR family transcriptional regulator